MISPQGDKRYTFALNFFPELLCPTVARFAMRH